jgi:RraA family protein
MEKRMIGNRRNPSAAQAEPALISGFKNAATAIISDNLSRLQGAVGLRPFYKGGVMVGTALTVRTCPGDNLVIHESLDLIRPGDVLVVDGGGDISRALMGEIMITIAQSRGAAGVVIDGAIRDAGIVSQSSFPCFARGAIHKGPYKNGPGEINVPVTVGGMVVESGDMVVGDDDGVVAFPQAIAPELLKAVRMQQDREAEILLSIREGRYKGAYGKPAKAAE